MNFSLYYHTLKHLRWQQVWFRLPVLKKIGKPRVKKEIEKRGNPNLKLGEDFVPSYLSYLGNNKFTFLNLEHQFEKKIDWNFSEFGLLWNYNLCYFDFLNQEEISKEEGLLLIDDFIQQNDNHRVAYDPYPISLRIINWVKFISKYKINNEKIDRQLYEDCIRLTQKLEYHLLANHLLENGFGLLFGAYYFQDKKLFKIAWKIVARELKEQILPDGGHYELSPMYHQIILTRVLDSYNLMTSNKTDVKEIINQETEISFLLKKAEKMLGWLGQITFNSGEIPYVNDSAPKIAPTTRDLLDYAERLGIKFELKSLKESGYRMFKNKNFELLFDVGQIAPSYQPGHSHADNLNFLLNIDGKPIIVETGISTYEKNERRQLERSTSSHNTITINGENTSQVWGGFRVGKRAKTKIENETGSQISAFHSGYTSKQHHRKIEFKENEIILTDSIKNRSENDIVEGYLHFTPEYSIELNESGVVVEGKYKILLEGIEELKLVDYLCARGFNDLIEAKKISYKIKSKKSIINIKIA